MDRIGGMEDGKIVEQGSPRVLLHQDGGGGVKENPFRRLIAMNGKQYLRDILTKAGA